MSNLYIICFSMYLFTKIAPILFKNCITIYFNLNLFLFAKKSPNFIFITWLIYEDTQILTVIQNLNSILYDNLIFITQPLKSYLYDIFKVCHWYAPKKGVIHVFHWLSGDCACAFFTSRKKLHLLRSEFFRAGRNYIMPAGVTKGYLLLNVYM